MTREERARILAGDHSALKRKRKPECSEGDRLILIWSRARTVVVDRATGETAQYPRRPLFWVELSDPLRHRDGGWRVTVTPHDERTSTRFLGPAAAPAADSLTEETERGYRPTAAGAIDELEAVDDEELRRQNMKAKERWTEHREQMAAEDEARRQERVVREKLVSAVRELAEQNPLAARALLAGIERQISEALEAQGSPLDELSRSTIRRRRAR